ncbi:ABC transporter ATP-binding protein [Streptomyces sp. NPDC002920]
MHDTGQPLIEARALSAGYGARPVVSDLDIEVRPGEVVALLGPNGAGKTTTLRVLSGDLTPMGGEVLWLGTSGHAPLHRRAREGLAYVGERAVFSRLDTADNLRVGRVRAERALALFPELEKRMKTGGGMLSGGEQQMLSLARALMVDPRLVIADELSLGLAPRMVDVVFESLRRARAAGVAVIMIEQFASRALDFADRCLVLQRGRIAWSGDADRAGPELLRRYLGDATAA